MQTQLISCASTRKKNKRTLSYLIGCIRREYSLKYNTLKVLDTASFEKIHTSLRHYIRRGQIHGYDEFSEKYISAAKCYSREEVVYKYIWLSFMAWILDTGLQIDRPLPLLFTKTNFTIYKDSKFVDKWFDTQVFTEHLNASLNQNKAKFRKYNVVESEESSLSDEELQRLGKTDKNNKILKHSDKQAQMQQTLLKETKHFKAQR